MLCDHRANSERRSLGVCSGTVVEPTAWHSVCQSDLDTLGKKLESAHPRTSHHNMIPGKSLIDLAVAVFSWFAESRADD